MSDDKTRDAAAADVKDAEFEEAMEPVEKYTGSFPMVFGAPELLVPESTRELLYSIVAPKPQEPNKPLEYDIKRFDETKPHIMFPFFPQTGSALDYGLRYMTRDVVPKVIPGLSVLQSMEDSSRAPALSRTGQLLRLSLLLGETKLIRLANPRPVLLSDYGIPKSEKDYLYISLLPAYEENTRFAETRVKFDYNGNTCRLSELWASDAKSHTTWLQPLTADDVQRLLGFHWAMGNHAFQGIMPQAQSVKPKVVHVTPLEPLRGPVDPVRIPTSRAPLMIPGPRPVDHIDDEHRVVPLEEARKRNS